MILMLKGAVFQGGRATNGCTLSWCGDSIKSLFLADCIVNAARPAFSRSSFSRAELFVQWRCTIISFVGNSLVRVACYVDSFIA